MNETHETGQEALTDNSENKVRTQEALIGKGIDSCRSRGGGAPLRNEAGDIQFRWTR